MTKLRKFIIFFGFILIFILIAGSAYIYSQIDGSLPQLEGKRTLLGLKKAVQVDRDEQGIVTIIAESRTDAAVALGYVHAQERFFQMDLLRKNSAGELSSLFGELALDYDKRIRQHRFRDRARKIVSHLPKEQVAFLKAYTQGVNQGLKYMNAKPFEYLLLQLEPVEWQEEDTVLAVFSMYLDLQSSDGKRERTLDLLRSTLGDEAFAFLNPKGSRWDAAVDGTVFPAGKMPELPWPSATASTVEPPTAVVAKNDFLPGSNNWAVSGQVSATKSAIVANDMHLGIRVPNTWFRASLEFKVDDQRIKVTGTTLPGAPNIITGSNGHIAWGYTNSYGDWSDVIELKLNEAGNQYLTPDGWRSFTYVPQVIAIKDKPSEEIMVQETIWGPVIGENHLSQPIVYRWVAHDLEAVNLNQMQLEQAKTVDEAFAIAATTGIPAQNLMVGDNQGNIGWTIMGPIPQKIGQVGDLPTDWSTGENAWGEYLSASQYPKVKNPVNNRLWTGNSRVVGGEMYEKIGNGGYALGARSQQIRDDLMAIDHFDEQALLDVALDDNAIFLTRWQQFLLERVLTADNIANKPLWQEAKRYLSQSTTLQASIDSVAYRIVRNFRYEMRDLVFSDLTKSLKQLDESFSLRSIRHQIETPLWQLVTQQPDNFMLRPEDSWQALFAKALDSTLAEMTENQPLSEATWGQQNTSNIQHPLSKAVPFIGRWLDMPNMPLAGDSYMPRVQGTDFGASERMIVSPGHEERGIFHMPTSQAGHPWSPYYGLGHKDWTDGKPSAFLPGETKYSMVLLSY
ncbi:penicillin acylase family protein [Thalassotalea sp. LPB0316]|uniref:penicillin acylase family protein n=1 Tax=Thalassotalea sp. LPB0316 TaxID=2769490 RepID=UPI001865F568|nr:penicillin acylase family protein [Thalassotalea sp. LPB0316]QOL26951.1 penicillin acylase family protein [Thalassotalea sp. LPB0316]